jgi:His/Glu/Gln/Arg/opine family amino acid ABC transporter permease subunit
MTFATVFEWLGSGNNLRFLLEGFLTNLEIAVVAIIISLVVGLALALLRLSRTPGVPLIAGIWVDLFRNLPLLLLILFLFLWIPQSARETWEDVIPGWMPEAWQSGLMLAGLGGLVLYNSAVLAEIMRAGILSLPRGQGEAASALGMSYRQRMRHVILPQGLRRMVPATVSQLITLTKDTTLVSIIAIVEVMRRARTVTATSGNPFTGGGVEAPILEVFIFVGVLFIIVNFSLSRLSRRLEIRETRRTAGTAEKPKVEGLEDLVA